MSLVLFGCSNIEDSENEKIRRRNCKGEYISRKHDEMICAISEPEHIIRAPYPWESNIPRITKEFFRCKGSAANPPIIDPTDPTPHTDCEGNTRHGLPILHGQQNIYPILLDLLNYIQKTTNKRVVITSGHRCPAHNTYIDPSKENRYSKHQMGAEVAFYVQDMEKRPMEIVQLLMEYYRKTSPYKGQKEYEEFLRYDKPDAHVITKPWYNKEIFIKYYSPSEGRNGDNRHSFPYIAIQVRFDRDTKERVVFDWKKANLYPHD